MYFSKTVLCFSKGIYFILDYLYTKVQNKIFIYIKSYKIILLKGHWTGDFGYLFFSLNMLGQPRKYGCHQKKLPPIPLRGSYDALKSSRYCPVPRATVQFLALLSSFLALLSSFLMLLSSFLELLSSFLELLSSSSRYCPVSSRYCPVPRAIVQFPPATVQFPHATVQFPRATVQFPRAIVQFPRATVQCPRATVQFLALLSSFLALLSSPFSLLHVFDWLIVCCVMSSLVLMQSIEHIRLLLS